MGSLLGYPICQAKENINNNTIEIRSLLSHVNIHCAVGGRYKIIRGAFHWVRV